ncbi:tRNA (adenosine(37)-N6)-threonylcarbamoyltransferase complex transferase subunit TsaD, partial [Candidatus Uhrbacteria bacterium]|nr:tRNA (adenosine(37)-N6)-threonylcarbamoyltransferase complex transferase subunit TsaD [Candidatus Uhrbacteria bacterium]
MRRTHICVLGIESSCDETAAAVVDVHRQQRRTAAGQQGFSFRVLSNVVASQVSIHAQYGGVVPEVAAREHVTSIIPVVAAAMTGSSKPTAASRKHNDTDGLRIEAVGLRLANAIDAIAVTAGPGLITSLAVGVDTARTLAYAWKKPLIAVNHIEGHVVSSVLPHTQANDQAPMTNVQFPALALIVSGGHTELLLMRGWGTYECIGATRDDAAGEAFDKVAKMLGLAYPGGPAVAAAAAHGNPTAFNFPRGMLHSKDFDFSFSGLKTAVRYTVSESEISNLKSQIPNLCASFQQAVVDVLVAKTIRAASQHRVKTVLLGGGVAANTALRSQLCNALRT